MASHRPSVPGTSKSPTPPRRIAESDRSFGSHVASYFKKAVVVLAVWAAGFYKFSPSWLLLALVLYVWRERQQAAKQHNIAIAQDIARDEKRAILARVEDLPPWVYFPDVERAEWVNKIVDQLWPYIGEYVRIMLKEVVEPKVKESLPAGMGSFKFSRIDLGDIAPRIGGVKVYTENIRRDEIFLDLEINYASDSNLAVQVKGMNFGVRDLTLRGTLRIILRPLLTSMPLIGGVTIFFLNNPELDFNLTNLANAFDLPGLSEILHSIIEDQIAEILVLPNRLPIQIAQDVDLKKLLYPLPQGVLRVEVIEARDLIASDIKVLGKAKSDPYAIVMVGAQSFQTSVKNDTLTPQWNQMFEYVVDEREGQLLKLVVKDKDTGNKDDSLGSTSMDISVISQKGSVDEWLPLEEVSRGIIHLRSTWLYLSADPNHFTEIQGKSHEEDILHTALLIVHLDSAMDLPRGQRSLQEPSPFALLTVGQVTQESRVRVATADPSWEQSFRFFVANPLHQALQVEVRDSKTRREIGETRVYLKKLLATDNMIMERWFPLSSPNATKLGCTLYMTVILRILTPNVTREWLESDMRSTGFGEQEGAPSREAQHPAGNQTKDAVKGERRGENNAKEGEEKGEHSAEGEAAWLATEREKTPQRVASLATAGVDVRKRRKQSAPSCVVSKEEERGQYGLGRLQLTLRYSSARQQLVVVVHRVTHLKAPDREGRKLPDAYVAVYLVQDRDSRAKLETPVVKQHRSPVFDAKLTFDIGGSEVVKGRVEVVVKNKMGLFSSSSSTVRTLGTALIPLTSFNLKDTLTLWVDLAPEGCAVPTPLNCDK